MSENWITLTTCFRNGKISYTSHEFWWLTFSHNCNEVLQAKIRPFKWEGISNEGSGSFLRLTTTELWKFSRTSSAVCWIKRKHSYKILKKFSSKNKFPQSPKSNKKYISKYNSSKWNGYRSVINIALNFEHVQIKNFNLYTRQIYFTDQNCVILRSWKITKRSR